MDFWDKESPVRRACLRKKKMFKWQAVKVMAEAKKNGKLMKKYRCEFCREWHLASIKQRVAA
jgi:hypothetical protein